MANPCAPSWYPTAAYLYVLHLDGPALAWEYLRRHPDYRRDWRRRRSDTAQRWGLRLLENPTLDARDAHPAWFPDHDAVLQLHPETDPPLEAVAFTLWQLPGHKHLIHDGRRLLLVSRWAGGCLRFALAPDLADGMAYAYAVRASDASQAHCQALSASLKQLATATGTSLVVVTRPRPSLTSLLELHTLQALDATLAGASLRDVAEGLFGVESVADDWHADSALRARVRRLVRRGNRLMQSGYRHLAQLPPAEQGRATVSVKRP